MNRKAKFETLAQARPGLDVPSCTVHLLLHSISIWHIAPLLVRFVAKLRLDHASDKPPTSGNVAGYWDGKLANNTGRQRNGKLEVEAPLGNCTR